MPRILETTVYKYDELEARAQERARDWYRNGLEFDAECTLDESADVAAAFGLDVRLRRTKRMDGSAGWRESIYYSGFYSQGDGACFDGDFRADKLDVAKCTALKSDRPTDTDLHKIIDGFVAFAAKQPEAEAQFRHAGHYSHSGCMRMEAGGLTSHDPDARYSSAQWDEFRAQEAELTEELHELGRNVADWIFDRLRADYEYQNSDEVVAETILANEYEFTEEGERA